ncbi:MAG: hypothetical protein D8M28_10055 [Proteobacteria bacterium]|nr:hypothetical protein [Pseudomonadota bacterium]
MVIAENICAETKWLYVNYEILIAADKEEVSDKFINTYAGNVWNALRRSLLNETLIGISKLIIDKKDNPSSFHSLHELLRKQGVLEIIKLNYTQAESEFQNRHKELLNGLLRLEEYLKTHDVVKSLVRHRNNYLVHRSQKVSSKTENLKWGDEKILIEIVSEIIHPMELLILNVGNISNSTRSIYKAYAENFWNGFEPNDEKFSW